MRKNDETYEYFILLKDKEQRISELIKIYDFDSVVKVIFVITSWRNNRGAQESCLALNGAVAHNIEWGNKEINTYNEFVEFFEMIYPILQISSYDDPVLNDFGEIKLNYKSHYYSVITGTGHTSPVFAALQYLELISDATNMNQFTQELIEYFDRMLSDLFLNNTLVTGDISLSPKFECPSIDYFKSVLCFFEEATWNNLDVTLLVMLSAEYNPLLKSHFVEQDDIYYPLFNPSLLIDYLTNIIVRISQKDAAKIIKSSLVNKIKTIYCYNNCRSDFLIDNCLFLDDQTPIKKLCACFTVFYDENVIVFIDTDENEGEYLSAITLLKTAFDKKTLSIANLDEKVSPNQCRAYKINNNFKLNVICYDEHINVDETVFKFYSEEKTIYSAIDLMYMIMISENILQLVEFVEKNSQKDMRIFSWGGISDQYTLYLEEKGYISKGAIEYTNIYTDIDTSAAHVFLKYIELSNCFPFHLDSRMFCEPECWKITLDENNIYQYVKKSREPFGGAVFVLNNKCVIFSSYDILNIIKNDSYQQANINIEFLRGIVERFIEENKIMFSGISLLDDFYIQFTCRSLSLESTSTDYIKISNIIKTDKTIRIDFEVACYKLMQDISLVDNRSVEYKMIQELFQPIFDRDLKVFDDLCKNVEKYKNKKKTANTKVINIDYYFNTDYCRLKETEVSELSVRKEIAQICAKAGVVPGVYERKDATNIVRRIQENAVICLEKKIHQLNRIELHYMLLSAYSYELFSAQLNQKSFNLCEDIDEIEKNNSQKKAMQAIENSKTNQIAFRYLIESNLCLNENRGDENIDDAMLSELLSFAQWLISLQSSSDLCFHTDSKTVLHVLDDYRIDVELGDLYYKKYQSAAKRRLSSDTYDIKGDETDREYFNKVANEFYVDTGVLFRVLELVLHQLSESSFPKECVNFHEVKPNVIRVNIEDVIKNCISFINEDVLSADIQKAFDFLTVDVTKLKTIGAKTYTTLPIWEREKRDNNFFIKPILKSGDSYIFSPIMAKETKDRWTNGFCQFYPPYEIGLVNTTKALAEWKNYYEHLFSTDIENMFRNFKFDYQKHDVDIRREDRVGKHPTINELGDFDVIGLSKSLKTVFIIECKVLQPIGSVFEHSNEQKRFFQKEKFDEKFQKRVNYFSKVYRSFFANIGYDLGDDEYQIRPYMVVNKVFDSYFKKISFPIVTYDELRMTIISLDESLNTKQ